MGKHRIMLTREQAAGLSMGSVVQIRVRGTIDGHQSLGETHVALEVSGEAEVEHQTMRDAFEGALASSMAKPSAGGVIPAGG